MQCVSLLTLFAVEIACRSARYDFDRTAEAFYRTPVFLRAATVPVGEAFFRKPGPGRWRGRAQSTLLTTIGFSGDPLPPSEDPVIVLEYDDLGFRNPQGLKDWDIAIAGDSFTELCTVPTEDLFTSRLGKELGLRVKNLGVAMTGTLTQTCYLEEFGKSASTKDAMVVFYEGNDLGDLIGENESLLKARAGRKENRSLEELPRQSSFLKAIWKMLRPSPPSRRSYNARFEVDGRSVPIAVSPYSPPGSDRLPGGVRAMLTESLRGWATTANRLNVKPWLVFMPCKLRVLHKHLKYTDGTPSAITERAPSDLPDLVRAMCRDVGIEFIDVSPRLIDAAARGRLTFNTVDTHLNAEGSACVAEVLADALRKDLQSRPAAVAPPTLSTQNSVRHSATPAGSEPR